VLCCGAAPYLFRVNKACVSAGFLALPARTGQAKPAQNGHMLCAGDAAVLEERAVPAPTHEEDGDGLFAPPQAAAAGRVVLRSAAVPAPAPAHKQSLWSPVHVWHAD